LKAVGRLYADGSPPRLSAISRQNLFPCASTTERLEEAASRNSSPEPITSFTTSPTPSILQNGTPSPLWKRAFSYTILTSHVLPQSTALKSIKSVAPLLDRVLVQRIKAASKTSTGIFLTESSVKELNEAKVLAVGPGAFDKEGKRISMGVSIGDKVLIPQVSFPAHEEHRGQSWMGYLRKDEGERQRCGAGAGGT